MINEIEEDGENAIADVYERLLLLLHVPPNGSGKDYVLA
jgi:hypothetical protein